MVRSHSPGFLDDIVAWSFDHPLPFVARYAVAAALVAAMGIVRVAILPDTLPWLLFIPAILAVSLTMGLRPGLFATVLSVVLGAASLGSWANPVWLARSQWTGAILFLLVMAGMAVLAAELRSSMRRANLLNADLAAREAQSVEREAFLASVLAASTDCIKVVELDGGLSFMSDGGMKVMEVSDFNQVRGCAWPDFLKGSGADLAREALDAAKTGRSSHFETGADTFTGVPKWWSVSVSPILGPNGAVTRILSVSRDHSALQEAREQQRLLNGELSHRLKNVLTLVQSIANQTLRDADSLEEASAAFSSRLASLGRATDMLTATSWHSADLQAAVDAGLTAVAGMERRVHVEGPPVSLNPQAAMALTLALHELATNAFKYGALSNETGLVMLRWQVAEVNGEQRLSLTWQERGGPEVLPPSRKGFGSRMIERSLAAYFRGATTLRYPPSGVEFSIDAPLRDAAAARGA